MAVFFRLDANRDFPKETESMSKWMRCTLLIVSMPVFLSLSGCPAMAAMRVAKKVSDSSNADDKNNTAKPTDPAASANEVKPSSAP